MESQRGMYARFGGMISVSTVVMFILTYTNVFALDHIWWSEERVYMSLLMGATMAIVMLAFMWPMLGSIRANVGIVVGALLVALLALGFSRSQVLIEDEQYMKSMIPHHSIAILTSERANIDDLRVQQLAEEIAATQRREISEMEWLINDIRQHGLATSESDASERPVPDFGAD